MRNLANKVVKFFHIKYFSKNIHYIILKSTFFLYKNFMCKCTKFDRYMNIELNYSNIRENCRQANILYTPHD